MLVSGSTVEDHSEIEANLLPGSPGEHALQVKYGSENRARSFYSREVLPFLSPTMCDFVSRQECLFISTSDAQGRCDCSPRFGEPGFIQVLDERHILYPEFRGNGVFASLGNISENPHIGLLIIDFSRDQIGLHINGRAKIVEQPERAVLIEVEEAYVHCSKHIPRFQKLDRNIDWGTDSPVAKKADYFQLKGLSLYQRLGGEEAVRIVVNRLGLNLRLAGIDTKDLDLTALIAAALGGQPFPSALIKAPDRDRCLQIFRRTLEELGIGRNQIEKIMSFL